MEAGIMNIPLWQNVELETQEGPNAGCPSATVYPLAGEGPYPVVVVLPGGGYGRRADHEGEPIAKWLNSIGIAAIVVNYRVAPYKHPVPLQDAQRAIRLVRHNAEAWKMDPSRVGILGFSAGGHLASTAGTHYDSGNPQAADPIDRLSSRPDLMVLCYPVISFGHCTHGGSKLNLLGENPDENLVALLSNETQITPDTPPTFLWHTANDGAVPVENSMLFAMELSRNKVPFDLHVFESGNHGLGLASNHPEAHVWPSLCEAWLRKQGF
jgi:acetyl esterase/lipase